ncbi:FAD-dependent oxidoreductase [Vannielia sp. SX4]|uniref:FAD-dependent oxidoreductase n=1 Tax=Vannielia sp. SX4 TaxID=3463852 RepID=UPI004058D451
MTEAPEYDCIVAGGGPAGMMAGLLFARAGCRVLVLEKHGDFLRDFRGDTVHPSTLDIFGDLGLLDSFLELPHSRLPRLGGVFGDERVAVADFSRLKARCRFIAMVPQWHLLDFIARAGAQLPGFELRMKAEVTGLVVDGPEGGVRGVTVLEQGAERRVTARLVIGADGRHSRVREAAGLPLKEVGAPIDVLWFSLPRPEGGRSADAPEPLVRSRGGRILVTIDRGDYFQCAYVIRKGGAAQVRAAGIDAFRREVAATVPEFAGVVAQLEDVDALKLLTVRMDRLERWSRPGLVMIGDGAHAMSPIGGVGINLAVQDAVAAANLFAGPLAEGRLGEVDLEALRLRRAWPARATQALQGLIQNRLLGPILESREGGEAPPDRAPLPLRIVSAIPWLQRRVGAVVGLGLRPEHPRSPERHRLEPPGS